MRDPLRSIKPYVNLFEKKIITGLLKTFEYFSKLNFPVRKLSEYVEKQ